MKPNQIVYVDVPSGTTTTVRIIALVEVVDKENNTVDVRVCDVVQGHQEFPALLSHTKVVSEATKDSNTVLCVPSSAIVGAIEESAPNGIDYVYWARRFAVPVGTLVRFLWGSAHLVAFVAEHKDDVGGFIQVESHPLMNTELDLRTFQMFASSFSAQLYSLSDSFLPNMEMCNLDDRTDIDAFRARYARFAFGQGRAMFAKSKREIVSHVVTRVDEDDDDVVLLHAFTSSNSFLPCSQQRGVSWDSNYQLVVSQSILCGIPRKGDVVYTWSLPQKPHPRSGRQTKQWVNIFHMQGLDAFLNWDIDVATITMKDVDRLRDADGEHTLFSSLVLGYLAPRRAFGECPLFAAFARLHFWMFEFAAFSQ